MAAHSRFSPSALPHLEKCPGFLGGLQSEAASRGTELNDVIDQVLAGDVVEISEEFAPKVDMAIREIRNAQAWVGEPNVVMTQVRLKGQIPETDGTVDAVILNDFDSKAVVLDWKSGWTKRPPAVSNMQLASYGAAAVAKWDLDIVQLRLVELDQNKTTTATFKGHNLCAQVLPKIFALIKWVQRATEKDWSANSSCKYCLRQLTCPAISRDVLVPAHSLAVSITDDPAVWVANLTATECGQFLTTWKERVDLANSILKHVEQRAIMLLEIGSRLDGWKMGEGKKMRKWSDEQSAKECLVNSLGQDVLETSLKSPAQIEKTFGKAGKELVKGLVTTTPTKKLVPDD